MDSFSTSFDNDFSDMFIIDRWQVERKLAATTHIASGPGGIPVYWYEPLCPLFIASIRQGRVPDEWKIAMVVPVSKVTPPQSVQNDLRDCEQFL